MRCLPTCPESSQLAEILALTLGFRIKRNYDQKQLAALVSILPSILKCKGTQDAIDLAGNALIKASGAQGSFIGKVVDNVLEVIIPKDSVDVNLFLDVLPYILPAGLSVNIVKRTVIQGTIETESGYETTIKAALFRDYEFAELAGSYEPFKATSKGLNHRYVLGNDPDYVANPGLLDNTIIPILASSIKKTGDVLETVPELVKRPTEIYNSTQDVEDNT
jgi:hypothetical protein